jgi:hypothetical protein
MNFFDSVFAHGLNASRMNGWINESGARKPRFRLRLHAKIKLKYIIRSVALLFLSIFICVEDQEPAPGHFHCRNVIKMYLFLILNYLSHNIQYFIGGCFCSAAYYRETLINGILTE